MKNLERWGPLLRRVGASSPSGSDMPGKIQILPDQVSQAIAAGEVVERPASVVKELMENAIDAGGSEIIVELRAGGLQLIRVCDNGEGIGPEDLPIALQRYATSKLKGIEDLYAIQTLGFRGEALPSIASVAQLMIKTRVPHAVSGTKIICEGGEIKALSEVGCPVGTEIEVKNIFYNIPVKRKFLKSTRSELRHSLNHFLNLSLSHPPISFKFIHDDRLLYHFLKTESRPVRVKAILGKEIYDHLQTFEMEDREIKISGLASLPSFSKGHPDGIYIYVNRRSVKDRVIYKAVTEAYRHTLPSGKFPVAILFITLPPYAVDVNVHPTKAEVKFREPERVYQAVYTALRTVLGDVSPLAEREMRPQKESKSEAEAWIQPSFTLREPPEPYSPTTAEPFSGPSRKYPVSVLGQIRETYILCEREGNLIFIDQHAAHERLLFDKYKEQYETGSIPVESFLLPIPLELSPGESLTLSLYLEEFQAMGFEIDRIGEEVFAIRSAPSWADQKEPKEIIKELLSDVSLLKKEDKGIRTVDAMMVTLSCHSAVRANLVLRREEMEALVDTLYPFDLSATCPHGRPIFFQYPLDELYKKFKRKS
jgi:DNA mismatch repair protein MutL